MAGMAGGVVWLHEAGVKGTILMRWQGSLGALVAIRVECMIFLLLWSRFTSIACERLMRFIR